MSFLNKLFGKGEPAKVKTPSVSPKGSGEACLAVFVFNSKEISDKVSGASYGEYAEAELLKAVSKTLEPKGGWTICSPMQACHGDLFEESVFGETPVVEVLGNWIRSGAFGIDAVHLDSGLVAKLQTGQRIGYIPYAVGAEPMPKSHAQAAHQELKGKSAVGYLGFFTLGKAPPLAIIASKLLLPCDMKIRDTKCSGWLASSEALRQAGLED